MLRVLIFLLACNVSGILPGLLAGLHQHFSILKSMRGEDA